jgi:hypothetical protein
LPHRFVRRRSIRDHRAVPRAARETGLRTTWGGWSRGQFTSPTCARVARVRSAASGRRAFLPPGLPARAVVADRDAQRQPVGHQHTAAIAAMCDPQLLAGYQRREQEHRVLEGNLRVAHERAIHLEGFAQQCAARHGRCVLCRAVNHDGLPGDEAEQTAHAGKHRRLPPHSRRPGKEGGLARRFAAMPGYRSTAGFEQVGTVQLVFVFRLPNLTVLKPFARVGRRS